MIGVKMGNVAIILLWIVALPGIFKRFRVQGWLQNAQIILMAVRRRIGVLMFTSGLMHYSWNRLFLFVKAGNFPSPDQIPLFERFGLFGLSLLLPLFLTSNDYAVRILKKNWDRIHYLIYPAIWMVALHTTFMGGRLIKFALPTYLVAILQLASRIYDRWFYNRFSSDSLTKEKRME
jgi:sulfoxide reductase heme-binding subunit YedZ